MDTENTLHLSKSPCFYFHTNENRESYLNFEGLMSMTFFSFLSKVDLIIGGGSD